MRRAHGDAGVTLIELILAVTILGIIMGPLTASIIVGLKTTDKAQAALSDGTAIDLLNIYLAPDVQNTNPSDRLALNAQDCRGPGSSAAIVFKHIDSSTVSYSVETVDGEPALTRRDSATACSRQVIAPGLAPGYQLNGGAPTPATAPTTGTLHLYCGDLATECSGVYTNLKLVTIDLTTPTGHTAKVRATTRT